MMMICVYKTI